MLRWGNLKEREHLKGLGIDGQIIIKLDLKEIRWGHGMN
jgi:hypothetical protein